MANKKYGWVPDVPDARDHVHVPMLLAPGTALPTHVDLTPQMPPVYDQGDLGSCTANAIGGAIEFLRGKEKLSDFVPSRLFVYYNERMVEHTVASDSGAMIRDGFKVIASYGAPPETDWPYDISKFTAKPSAKAYTDGKKDLVKKYQRVQQDLQHMKACLASGLPFVFGFTVYDSISQADTTGDVPMPGPNDVVEGGHAVLCCGFSDTTKRFIFRNSWGTGWGNKGYGTIPYEYLTNPNLADDFWVAQVVG